MTEPNTELPTLAQEINAYLAEGWSGPRDKDLLTKAAEALAGAETQGLSHALMLKGVPDLLGQLDAQARLIKERDRQLALAADTLGSIWLYVNWHYVSKQLTTEQKELWADAIDDSGDPAERGPKAERWWRDDAPAPAHDEVLDRLREAMRKDTGPTATEAESQPCGQVHDGAVCTERRVPSTNGCWGHYGPEVDPDARFACDAARHVSGQVPCPHCVPIPGRPTVESPS